MSILQPEACDDGSGSTGPDVEQTLLCDTLPNGDVVGTALAVYQYDENGAPVGAPTFVDPATGQPYVPQGTLLVCPGEEGCLAPVQFCFTTTATGPVDHPGRQYDITLPINPGFAVETMQVDAVTNAANIVWDVSDPDGEQFRQALTTFMEGRLPAAAVVTITNPNAGQVVCGTAAPMTIHIECLRLDQSPPDLIELVYNGGQDMVINPAYNENPPLNPPVSQGNYGFHLLARQDDPGPFPGNPPAGRAVCTNVANRGWETNDVGRTFEIWGQDQVNGQNVTPTPRGTPVQEITSDGPPPGGRSTIWQTFQAPASGNFLIRVVHGARDPGENHRITLDNGDTGDAQNGDLIDDVTNNVGVVANVGAGPWTTFNQSIPLVGGSTYTLALSTNNPAGGARGGLFTDMRAYIDRPDQRATATVDDDSCVVTVDETTTVQDPQYWSPRCINGDIVSWRNTETGAELDNAAFWGQAPAPVPGECQPEASSGTGGSVAANLIHTYPVCAVVGGVRTNLQRVVVSDASGGVLAEQFIGPDGGPVQTPTDYEIGYCDAAGGQTLGPVCYQTPDVPGITQRGFMTLDADGDPVLYDSTGQPVQTYALFVCAEVHGAEEILCDQGNGGHQFIRRYFFSAEDNGSSQVPNTSDFELDGFTEYAVVGPVTLCTPPVEVEFDFTEDAWCFNGEPAVRRVVRNENNGDETVLWTDPFGIPIAPQPTGADELTPGPCPVAATNDFEIVEHILCDDNGSFIRRTLFTQDNAPLIVDVELDGTTPYVPVGEVDVCQPETVVTTERDVETIPMCDTAANGTQTPFLRRQVFNSADGTLVSSTDLTLAGAPYVPAGTVNDGPCPSCCPLTVAEVCLQNGHRGVIIRQADGTLLYTDTQTGGAFNPAVDIVTCPTGAPAAVTVNAQHLLLAAGQQWTPAQVAGNLVSVTATIITGTGNWTDSNGTAANGLPAGLSQSWSAEDSFNNLNGPQIIAAVGGQTLVAWVERP